MHKLLALDSLNLEIQPGKIFFLLGANGAGKTTTINLFLNFITPTMGSVFINGIDATQNPLDAKKYVSFLSEKFIFNRLGVIGDFIIKKSAKRCLNFKKVLLLRIVIITLQRI